MTELFSDALIQIIILSLPFLIVGLLISSLVGVFQAITQIQDATLTFVPKLVVLLLLVVVGLPWLMEMLSDYTGYLFRHVTLTAG